MLVVNEGKVQTQNQTIHIVALDVLFKLATMVVTILLTCALKKLRRKPPTFYP